MDLVVRLLEALNSLAETAGAWVLSVVEVVLPVGLPTELAAPVGWLALLTGGLALAEVAKKLTWVVVGIGWVLVAIRIVMVVIRA